MITASNELFSLFSLHGFFSDVPTMQVSELFYTLQYFFVSKECLFLRLFFFFSDHLGQQ
jgi:hypothetical protein